MFHVKHTFQNEKESFINMVNYLELLSGWMAQPHLLLLILVVVYIIAGTVDYIAGTLNAIFTDSITFSSRVSQLGIMRKLLTLACMILVIPFALMLPFDVGVYTLSVLFTGICASEVYSILGHAGIVKDGNKHKNILAMLFDNLFGKVLKEKGVSDDK